MGRAVAKQGRRPTRDIAREYERILRERPVEPAMSIREADERLRRGLPSAGRIDPNARVNW